MIKFSKTELAQKIERLVLERNTPQAKRLIIQFLRLNRNHGLEAKLFASEWYRRLGLNREGYILIAPKSWNVKSSVNSVLERQQWVKWARFLNLLGATPFAAQIAKEIKPNRSEEWAILAIIFLSDYQYEIAKRYFKKSIDTHAKPLSYDNKINRIMLADCYSGLGRPDLAIKEIDQIPVNSDEKLLRGIIYQAKGEYWAHLGQFEKSIRSLEQAETFFSEQDNTVGKAVIKKWLAYSLASQKKQKRSSLLYEESLSKLTRPDLKAEAWLEAYYLMDKTGELDTERKLVLYGYPGTHSDFLKRKYFPQGITLFERNPKFEIFSARNEWVLDGKYHWGIPQEILLLSYLRCGAQRGVSIERLKWLLWPQEIGSYLQLDNRIFKMLGRLKSQHKIKTKVQESVVYLDPLEWSKISVEVSAIELPHHFFENKTEFDRDTFATFYQLKRSMALQILADQVARGVIKRKPLGKASVFNLVTKKNS